MRPKNCLLKTNTITEENHTQDTVHNDMTITDDHQLPYIGDFPPKEDIPPVRG